MRTAFRIFVAIILVCLVVFVLLLMGCSTVDKALESRTIVAAYVGMEAAMAQLPEWNPALDKELESRATVAAYFSLSSALNRYPGWEDGCHHAFDHIRVQLDAQTVHPSDVVSAFNLLPIKELRSDSTVIFPEGANIILQKDLGIMGVVEEQNQLRAILRGIGKGLVLARPEWRGMPALKPPPMPFGRNELYDERSRKRR